VFIVCLKKGNRVSDVSFISWKCLGCLGLLFFFFTGTEITHLQQSVNISLMLKCGQDWFQQKMVCVLTTFGVLYEIKSLPVLTVLFLYQVNQDN